MAHNEALKCNAQQQQQQQLLAAAEEATAATTADHNNNYKYLFTLAAPLTEAFLWAFWESIWRLCCCWQRV